MWRTVVLAMILLASRGAWAEPPSPPPVLSFPTSVDVVRLTVTVTDKKGNLVSDLRADEIEVREDGRPQKIHFLAHTKGGVNSELDLSVALLLDVSRSMADVSKLSREAALLFLDAVPRARQLQVVLFARQIVGLRYKPETRNAILQAIVDTPPGGGTPLFDAVQAAVTRLDTEGGRRVVVILSDGEDCGSRLRLEGLLRFLRASDATVYALDFSRRIPTDEFAKSTRVLCASNSPRALSDIASTTGGTAYRAGRPEDVPGILEKILAELRSQYVLGYVSDAPRQDGQYRKVEVRLKRRGLAVRHKTGYTAKGG